MSSSAIVVPRVPDRVEAFIEAIDAYSPTLVADQVDAFRIFARFVSRSLDGRYLDRHPPVELLPDLEHLMRNAYVRPPEEIRVQVELSPEDPTRRGVLTACLPDQPFLYSAVQLALEHLSVRRYRAINTGVPINRDDRGHLVGVGQPLSVREAYIWIEIEATHLDQRQDEIEHYIFGRLEAARDAVADWHAMHHMVERLATRFDALAREKPDHRTAYTDNARLLRWLLEEHFVILGSRYISQDSGPAPEGLGDFGVGRLSDWRGIQLEGAEQTIVEYSNIQPFLWIRKSRTESWVYRSGRTDHILVQAYDEENRPTGIVILEGLFSFHALAEPRTDIPLLDRIIDQLYAQLRATKGTHRYRTIRNAFNSLPLEYLFSLQPEDIRSLVEQVLEADSERRIQVHITSDEQQATAFVFVALPRSHYNDELRSDIRRLLKNAFAASSVDDGVYAGDVDTVSFHYFLTGVELLSRDTEAELKDHINQLASPWSDRLFDELRQRHGEQEARRLQELYATAFPTQYQETTSVARAARDVEILDAMGPEQQFDCDIYREKLDEPLGVTRLRIFESQDILLSSILPLLDNLGLVVIDQFPTTLHVPGRPEQNIATFRIGGVKNSEIDLLSRRNRLRDAIRALVAGSMANDPLNRLLLRADIPWPYVMLMRAYEAYGRQIGSPYGTTSVRDVLLDHPLITRSITEFFRSKFDPDVSGLSDSVDEARLELTDRARKTVLTQLESVGDLSSDQVLRQFMNSIEATVRTNFYARDPMVEPCLAIKLDPKKIQRMPEPRPYREVFVQHPKVIGLHLRGGPVARGGIRWSDRRLDFRTEVLGLMATQNLKNVVIVPRGAKGSFVGSPGTELEFAL